jgi:lysophospholipase L1-like esterase
MDKISLWMILLLVVGIGGCSSSGSGTSQSGGGSTDTSSSQQKIIFTGASTIARGDWSSYFGIPIENRAVGGIESTELKNNIEGQVASKPQRIFISIGTNNILNRHDGVLINDISAIIDKIKTASPSIKIYIISILPVRDTFACTLIERYNDQIQSLCNSKNVKFISVYNLFKTSTGINETYYQADGIHLTPAGYHVLADAIRSHVLS